MLLNAPHIDLGKIAEVVGVTNAAGVVREGGQNYFISTGIGTSILPVRFRVPPEVSVVLLRALRP